MKKITKIEDIVNSSIDNTEVVVGLKGTSTVMFIDKKMRATAEKIFTDANIEFDTYLIRGADKIPLFVVKSEDFAKIVKIMDKMKGTI